MTVIRRDAPNADWTNICLLRESPTLLQRYSGAATREISAMTSAAKKKIEDHRVKFTHAHLLGDQCSPHTREGHCNEIRDLFVRLAARAVGDADGGENDAHARSPQDGGERY